MTHMNLRWCPICEKPTIQAKRKDGVGKTVWYCPICARGNRDSTLSSTTIVAEPPHFKLADDWGIVESELRGKHGIRH